MEIEELKLKIRDIPDFPSKGIIFRDLTTLLKEGAALRLMSDELVKLYEGKGVTKIVGIESRGFIGGSIMAYKLGCGFVPAQARQAPVGDNQESLRQGVWCGHNRASQRRHQRE